MFSPPILLLVPRYHTVHTKGKKLAKRSRRTRETSTGIRFFKTPQRPAFLSLPPPHCGIGAGLRDTTTMTKKTANPFKRQSRPPNLNKSESHFCPGAEERIV